jgi:ABC-2 type transport system permease protein
MNTLTVPRSPVQTAVTRLVPHTAPRAAFGKLVRSEVKLAWRNPANLLTGVALPLLLLVIFSFIPTFKQQQADLGGLTELDVYVPVLIAMSIALLGLVFVPGPLVAYRDQGVLRRLSLTPVPPFWVLAAQLIVQACIALVALLIVLVMAITVFGVAAPINPGGLILAIILSIAALFAIGLTVAAVAWSGIAARAIGGAAFYPLLFFAGMWYPLELMPPVLRDVAHYTPLGATVEAIQDSMQGQFPPIASLATLAAYAIIFALVARRFFRWE